MKKLLSLLLVLCFMVLYGRPALAGEMQIKETYSTKFSYFNNYEMLKMKSTAHEDVEGKVTIIESESDEIVLQINMPEVSKTGVIFQGKLL